MLLTGKKLSARLIQAYISTMMLLMGQSNAMSILIALEKSLPDDIKVPWKPFLDFYYLEGDILVSHVKYNPDFLSDMDYAYTTCLGAALIKMYEERGGQALSRRIGRYMWQGGIRSAVPKEILASTHPRKVIPNPAYNGEQKEYSLLFFTREPILNALKAHFKLSQIETIQSLPPEKYLIAARTFAQVLNENLQIACDVEEQSDGIFLSFPDCPFCASQECKTWWGIIEGMYLWLDDQEPFITGQASPINEERSTTHRIFIAKSRT